MQISYVLVHLIIESIIDSHIAETIFVRVYPFTYTLLNVGRTQNFVR